MDNMVVLEIRTVIVMHCRAFALGQDPDLIQGFGAPFGVDGVMGQVLRAAGMQPLQFPIHAYPGFVVMADLGLLCQVHFDPLIDRADLLGDRQTGRNDRAFTDFLPLRLCERPGQRVYLLQSGHHPLPKTHLRPDARSDRHPHRSPAR